MNPPLPPHMGIWDFSKFGLSIKNWKLVSMDPPPIPPSTWDFGILANLDPASKVGNWLPPDTPPPPITLHMGLWDFSKFGLSIKSWKLVSTDTPLPSWTWEFGILVDILGDRILRKLIFYPQRSIF